MTQHHDPVHPDSPHLTPELLADLDEGLLDAASVDHAEHHLAHCPDCGRLRHALSEVSGALAALPPVTVPADVADRLDRLLAGLAVPSASTEVPVAPAPTVEVPAPRDTVVPLAAARSRRSGWSTRFATVAASVAGVLLVSAVGLSLVSGAGSGDAGGVEADAGGDGVTTARGDTVVADRSGRAYSKRALDEQVDTLLVASSQALDSPSPSAPPETTPEPMVSTTISGEATAYRAALVDPVVLRACIADYLLLPDTTPLAVDLGTFADQPAAIIVMPSAGDPTEAEVYVVDPDCSGPDATLLYYAVVPIPGDLLD